MDLGCLLLSPKLRVLHSWKSIRFHKRKGTALKVFLCWLSRWLGSIYRSAEHQCISKVLKFPCKSKVPRGFAQSALAKCWCNVGCTEWCVVCNSIVLYGQDCRKKQNGHWPSDDISPKVVLRWLQAKVDFLWHVQGHKMNMERFRCSWVVVASFCSLSLILPNWPI